MGSSVKSWRIAKVLGLALLLSMYLSRVGAASGQGTETGERVPEANAHETNEIAQDSLDSLGEAEAADDERTIEAGDDPDSTRISLVGELETYETEGSLPAERGSFQTSLFTGAGSYQYPLELPPGTNDFAPQLSLNYSSSTAQGRADYVGLGWDIAASAITRDVEESPNNLGDDTFHLVLNGVSYDLVYLPADGRYHTKIESNLYIEYKASGAPNSYGAYWIVRVKDGTEYRFGHNPDAERTCSSRSYAWKWYLDEIVDVHGNHIYFGYRESPFPQDIGASYPDTIVYNNDLARVIQFVYEGSDRSDRPLVYEEGCRVRYSRRLSSIDITVGGETVRSYAFSYNNGTNAKASQLTAITEKGSDGTPLPATTFTYENENRSWNDSYSIWAPVDTPFLDDTNVELHDVNRDGLVDIVDGDEIWRVYLNSGSSWDEDGVVWLTQSGHELGELDTVIADVNGDGLADIVEGEGTTWKVNINNGQGWQGPTNWPAGSDHDLEELDTVLSDANGDGLPDIVEGEGPNWTVNLNHGSGWNSPVTWPAGSDHNLEELDTVLLDVNGDGLPDIVEGDTTWTVNLNNGSGWDSPQTWLVQNNHKLDEYDTNMSDVNADGLTDIIEGDGESGWDVNLNNGSGWDSPVSWLSEGPDFNTDVALADANGDGYPDIVTREGGEGWLVYKNRGNQSNLLVGILNGLGGTITLSYGRSTQYDNSGTDDVSDLGFNVWIVESVARDNGMTGSHHVLEYSEHTYQDGLHDYQDREFRGFGLVTETDSESTSIRHNFHQDDALKGRESSSEVRDAGGNLYLRVENSYSSDAQGEGYIVNLTRTERHTHDGAEGSPKTSFEEFTYDGFGNTLTTLYGGDIDVSDDERYEHVEYVYNGDLWIVDKPKRTYVNASNDATRVRESWFYYDGHAGLDEPPIRGDLTRQEDWSNTGDNPVTLFNYDSYGNQTHETDANGRTTEYVFGGVDPTFTFPEKVINPKGHELLLSYDLGTGNLLSETDPNLFVTNYEYDVFGRIIKEIRPYDSAQFPTVGYDYLFDGVAPEGIVVSQRTVSGQNFTLDTYTFVDGFGRETQTRSPAEAADQQVVVNTFYNNTGLVAEQSVPHFDAFHNIYSPPVPNTRSTLTFYDVIDRETQVVNPDDSSRSVTYDHWREDAFDENGHQVSYYRDAFENIVRIDEHNGPELYITHYTYSPVDELLSITDHHENVISWVYDSLGRQTEQQDPDLGLWLYEYDANGNLVAETDNRGITTSMSYDELDRIILEDFPSLTDSVYTYDVDTMGTLSSIQHSAGITLYYYDQRLRQVREDQEMDGLVWTTLTSYDAADRVTSITYPDGEVVAYTYNNQGVLETVGELMEDFDYDAFGRIVRKEFANGVITDLNYAQTHFRLQSIQTTGLQDLSYEYDPVGNVTAIANGIHGTTEVFTYDDLNRLETADEEGGYNRTYTYDAIGNLVTVTTEIAEMSYQYGQNAGPHAVTEIYTFWHTPLVAGLLQYNASPVIGESAVASFSITNVSGVPLELNRVGVGARGPYCQDWDCPNIADYPWVEDILLQPGEEYAYSGARAFNVVDDEYIARIYTEDAEGLWWPHGPVYEFGVETGIQVVEQLTLVPEEPIDGEEVEARYTIRNESDQIIEVAQLGVVARGPDCTDWECEGWADFPPIEDVTLQPGEEYEYVGNRIFDRPGTGYFADVAFSDVNPWWYATPNGERVHFAVRPAFETVADLVLTPSEPAVAQTTIATFRLKNVSGRVMVLDRIGVGVHGPYCNDWNCSNISDFPWIENVTLQPGEEYAYSAERAFNVEDDGYLAQIFTVDSTGFWRSHSAIHSFSVIDGIEIVETLTLTPEQPIDGEEVEARYTIRNSGDQVITLPQLGVIARGPDCTDWDCDGWADFPPITNVVLEPGEEFEYVGTRSFAEPGTGYLADAVFSDTNNWWYTLPNNERVYFTVMPALETVEDLQLTPANPAAGRTTVATFKLKNVSSRVMVLDRIGVGVHGPYCSDWDCPNYSDFPWAEDVTLQPGEEYAYSAERAFNVVDDGYLAQVFTVDSTGLWRSHSAIQGFSVKTGIEIIETLTLSPEQPIVGQDVEATYTIRNNSSNQVITLAQVGVIARGPNCSDWDCEGWADFPPVHDVTLGPGEEYIYTGSRSFAEVGTGYIADAAFSDANVWWYALPNSERVHFAILEGMKIYLPIVTDNAQVSHLPYPALVVMGATPARRQLEYAVTPR